MWIVDLFIDREQDPVILLKHYWLARRKIKCRMSSTVTQVSRVRALYKAILRLHRGLPLQMRALGDQYVKDEFRRHKDVPVPEAQIFMNEWTRYYLTIGKQLAARKKVQVIGADMSPELIDCFEDEQVAQLYELYKETNKPLVESES